MEPDASLLSDSVRTVAAGNASFSLSGPQRLLMLLINYWGFMNVAGIGLTLGIPWAPFRWRLAAGLLLLYLVPPCVARILRGLAPVHEGRIPIGRRDFFVWWALFNLQVLFCRLPVLEELLRLAPGLYTLWLRLWGARIGRLTYWAAGLRILDRSFIRIGDDVIFGAGVRLNPHVLIRNGRGELELILATVNIGDRVVVGGYSLLTAGTVIAADECTRAFLISPPFSHWKNGTRIAKTDATP
jgi:acetyltransferase-like isoleucine patch superfamily enzyme